VKGKLEGGVLGSNIPTCGGELRLGLVLGTLANDIFVFEELSHGRFGDAKLAGQGPVRRWTRGRRFCDDLEA
jgi:hypothetical protein